MLPTDWIDDLYCLELEAETEIDLSSCGDLAIGFGGLWTLTQLGEAIGELIYEPTSSLAFGLSGTIDCVARQIEILEVVLTFEW